MNYVKVHKRGGSLAIILPKKAKKILELEHGDYLILRVVGKVIEMKKQNPKWVSE